MICIEQGQVTLLVCLPNNADPIATFPGKTAWEQPLPKPACPLLRRVKTAGVTLPSQTETDEVRRAQLNVPFGQAGFVQTHGVGRLSISGAHVVVTNLHNTNIWVLINLGLSSFFKGTELSHSAPPPLSPFLCLWDFTVASRLSYSSHVLPTVLKNHFSWVVMLTMTKLPTMCLLGIMTVCTTSITVYVAKLVCQKSSRCAGSVR